MKYRKVVVGGSFDVLHKGHKALLEMAFEAGNFVLIGLTSNEMLEKEVAPYEERKRALESFLAQRGNYEIVKLEGPMGDSATDRKIEAIVVSEKTLPQALKINKVRKQKGLDALEIIPVPMILAEDGMPISSMRIRSGGIDDDGRIL